MGVDQSGHDDPAPGVYKNGSGVFAFYFPGRTNFRDRVIPDGYTSIGKIWLRLISGDNPAVSNQQQAVTPKELKEKKCLQMRNKFTGENT